MFELLKHIHWLKETSFCSLKPFAMTSVGREGSEYQNLKESGFQPQFPQLISFKQGVMW